MKSGKPGQAATERDFVGPLARLVILDSGELAKLGDVSRGRLLDNVTRVRPMNQRSAALPITEHKPISQD